MGDVNSKRAYQIELDDKYKSSIKVKRRTAKQTEKLMKYVLEKIFLPEFLKNDKFNQLYDHTYYTGSFYDGLRVKDAKEFDVNIVLNMPNESKCIHSSPGHANIRILTDDWVFSRGQLSTETIKRWFKGMLDRIWVKVLGKVFTMNCQRYFITRKESGPASTVRIFSQDDNTLRFDLDLVPVFLAVPGDCFLVPKPSDNGDEYEWRLSYPHRERELLDGKDTVKRAIKILKYLRDCQNWKNMLKSYYIKTVAMHCMITSNNQNDLVLFLDDCVDLLKEYLHNEGYLFNQNIPFYHDHSYNLIGNISSIAIDNVRYRLVEIHRKVKANPKSLHEYLSPRKEPELQVVPMVSAEVQSNISSDEDIEDVDSDEELEVISGPRGFTPMEKVGLAAGVCGGVGLVAHGLSKKDEDTEETKRMKSDSLALGFASLAVSALYYAFKDK